MRCSTRESPASFPINPTSRYARATSGGRGNRLSAMPQPFHLAIPVHDLGAARGFYGDLFGCPEGRSSEEWVDFDFFGHQVVAHLDPARKPHVHHNEVDGHDVPVPHFGVVMECEAWRAQAEPLRGSSGRSEQEPGIRFAGQVGERATVYLCVPTANPPAFMASE